VRASKAYGACNVNQVRIEKLLAGREGQKVEVGLDIGKDHILAVVRFRDGTYLRPWRIENPGQVLAGCRLLKQMSSMVELKVAMESSGTYGDPLRQAMADANLASYRVSSKASHDWAEAFDGVPSQHDGKDAAVVAELCAMGKARPWTFALVDEKEQELAYWVDRLDLQRRLGQLYYGRLESRLARHWPEAQNGLPLTSATLLRALKQWGSPAALAADGQALVLLKRWGRACLSPERLKELIDSARGTIGVRMTRFDQRRLQDDSQAALAARKQRRVAQRRLRQLAKDHPILPAMAQVVGAPSACILWVAAGDPRDYPAAAAYRKAMGLNLAERSSGKFKGELRISKRGSSMARRALYYAALRYVSKPPGQLWYLRKKQVNPEGAMRAIIAVMRKLPLAVHAAAQGQAFDARRLFNSIVQREKPLLAAAGSRR